MDSVARAGNSDARLEWDLGAAVEGWQRYACVTQRVSTPVNGCAFGSQGESASADCRRACDPREVKKNALRCMLCQDKADLQNERR